jgi:PAS domain S-box-containing protein
VRWEIQPWYEASGVIGGIILFSEVITGQKVAADFLRLSRPIIENSPVVLFRWRASPGWPVEYVSDNVSQWGYRAEELMNGQLAFADLVPPEDMRRLEREVSTHYADGTEEFSSEYRILTRAGPLRWVEEVTTVERDADGKPAFLQGIVRDIHSRKLDELAMKERTSKALAEGEALSAATASAALGSGDIEVFAREVTEIAARVTGVARANVWLFDESEAELHCIDLYEAATGRHSSGMTLSENEFGNEFLALKSQPFVNADDALNDPRTAGYVDTYLKPLRITSMLDAVVVAADRRLGLLCLEHVDRAHHWKHHEIQFACRLADKIGLTLGNREARSAHSRLQASLQQTIRAIGNTVEVRDPYTAGHQHRVAGLAVAIGRELQLAEHPLRGLELAATIHDLGKVQVPVDILNKPGKLSKVEIELIRVHPQVGHDIVKDVDFPWPIAQAILQHHERQDGSGYPRGLQGEEILLEARIIAVADVVDAMATYRPYRPAHGPEMALAEIESQAGIRYDREVVRACLHLIRSRAYLL